MIDKIPVTECVLATEDAHLPPVVPGLHHHVHIVLNVAALGVALDNEMIILILKCLEFTSRTQVSKSLLRNSGSGSGLSGYARCSSTMFQPARR